MIYDVIYSLRVLTEKLVFFKKQLQGFIIFRKTCQVKAYILQVTFLFSGIFYLR